jgi:hypothetical protein
MLSLAARLAGKTRGFQPGGGTILQMPCSTHWDWIDMTYCSKLLNSSIVGWKTGHSRSPPRAPSAMLPEETSAISQSEAWMESSLDRVIGIRRRWV